MRSFIILLHLLWLITASISAQNRFIVPVDTFNIPINKTNYIFDLDANNDFLVFRDYTTRKLHTYSLKSNNLNVIEENTGLGGNKFRDIFDVKIDENNIIYLLNGNERKIITVDIDGKYSKDIYHTYKIFLLRLLNHNNEIYVSTDTETQLGSYYHQITSIENDIVSFNPLFPVINNDIEVIYEAFSFLQGVSDINDYHIVHGRRHHSIFDIFPLDTTKNKSVLSYDDYQEFEFMSEDGKTKTIYPPSQVYVELNEMFVHPNNDAKVYINAEGSTSNMSYYKNLLYEYDLKQKVFTNSYNLDYTPATIARHDDMIYIISKFEKNIIRDDEVMDYTNIYVYKILD